MVSPHHVDSLRESLGRAILDRLTEALLGCASIDRLANPVLRLEAFIQDGNATDDVQIAGESRSSPQLVVSVRLFSSASLRLSPRLFRQAGINTQRLRAL